MVTPQQTAARLAEAGVEDAAFDARILHELAAGDADKLESLTAKRAARYPLQYLCGTWDFLDFTLCVGEGVLIPRADTEIVAEYAIAAAQNALQRCSAPIVVDLCAGSGALAIGLARFVPQARVQAVELSTKALDYLQKNVAALAPRVQIHAADVFQWQQTQLANSIDVLVSNPPYITAAEMQTLAPELAHEPMMALKADENGLAYYRHIAQAYRPLLREDGTLVLEIGSTQAADVCALLQQSGWSKIHIHKDYAGLPRCIVATNSCNIFLNTI